MNFDSIAAKIDTKSAANEGAKMEVRDAAGVLLTKADGSPITITLLGRDSDTFVKQENANTNRRLAQGSRLKLTAEALKSEAISLLARCTVAWDFDEDCTYENARELYTRFPAIKEQADEFISDRANFTKA